MPDYVREFLHNVPRDLMRYEAGFYMGPDGFVFGREFVSKDPELSGQMEVDKHWYRFRLWGQLAYNPDVGRSYWEAVLEHRFVGVDAELLYDAWESNNPGTLEGKTMSDLAAGGVGATGLSDAAVYLADGNTGRARAAR